LRELRVSEMRYRAVLEVLDGAVISTVARRAVCGCEPYDFAVCVIGKANVVNLFERQTSEGLRA